MHNRKVSAKYLGRTETLATCNFLGANSTHVPNTEESDPNDELSEAWSSYSSESSDGIGETVKDAIAGIPTKIMELDKIGFEEILDFDETQDM